MHIVQPPLYLVRTWCEPSDPDFTPLAAFTTLSLYPSANLFLRPGLWRRKPTSTPESLPVPVEDVGESGMLHGIC